MKQKITMRVENCGKCRNKALKLAAEVYGVISVSIEGNDQDRLVVTGENVDAVCLGKLMKKKFCCVTLLTVEEVKPPKPPEIKPPGNKPPENKPPENKPPKCTGQCNPCSKCHSAKCRCQCALPWPCYGQCPPWYAGPTCYTLCPNPCDSYRVVYDPHPDGCSIL